MKEAVNTLRQIKLVVVAGAGLLTLGAAPVFADNWSTPAAEGSASAMPAGAPSGSGAGWAPPGAQASGAAAVPAAAASAGAPGEVPHDVRRLEKMLAIKLSHMQQLGMRDASKRDILNQAHDLDMKGEQALKAGDYASARDNFTKANDLLKQLTHPRESPGAAPSPAASANPGQPASGSMKSTP